MVNDDNVVLGVFDPSQGEPDASATVGDVITGGPPTMKPDTFIHDVIDDLRAVRRGYFVVTSHAAGEGGRYVGVLYREDAERVLEENEKL